MTFSCGEHSRSRPLCTSTTRFKSIRRVVDARIDQLAGRRAPSGDNPHHRLREAHRVAEKDDHCDDDSIGLQLVAPINRRLSDVVAKMTDEQLALQPSPERWPLWATIGHAACQRVFWLCDFGGEPGANSTPFTNAAFNCPGDDDLEHVLSADALVESLASTFAIVDRCLDRWSPEMLDEEIRHPESPAHGCTHAAGSSSGSSAHDVSHIAELNETLGVHGLGQVDIWS